MTKKVQKSKKKATKSRARKKKAMSTPPSSPER
jgi:hypothetical protein